MKVQGKVWGKTFALFNKNNVEVHYITTLKGGYCSKHLHATKYNKFIVFDGELKITVWKGDQEDITILTAGEECTVAPGDLHMFECLEDCQALEVYWTELNANDIERFSAGGMR